MIVTHYNDRIKMAHDSLDWLDFIDPDNNSGQGLKAATISQEEALGERYSREVCLWFGTDFLVQRLAANASSDWWLNSEC